MHLKVLIADDEVTTGSYNFSANAERNAENQIHLTDPGTVITYTDYINAVISLYTERAFRSNGRRAGWCPDRGASRICSRVAAVWQM
jgi:phosphatidylserine/phosphatidylglycerophosphate/cardiolipin synthase-like enzyme